MSSQRTAKHPRDSTEDVQRQGKRPRDTKGAVRTLEKPLSALLALVCVPAVCAIDTTLMPSQQTANIPEDVQRRRVVASVRPLLEDTQRIEQQISELEAERDRLVAELGSQPDSAVINEVVHANITPEEAVDRIQDGIFMVCCLCFVYFISAVFYQPLPL